EGSRATVALGIPGAVTSPTTCSATRHLAVTGTVLVDGRALPGESSQVRARGRNPGDRAREPPGVDPPEALLHAPDRDDRDVLAVLLAQRRVRVRGVDVALRPRDPRLGAHRLDDGARVVAQVAPRAAVQQDGRGRGVGRAHAPSVRGAAGATA